jgi:hypothetical protein
LGVIDWGTIASLATAGGTLVLAVATFSSVRSANRAARVAELSLLEGLRPLLVPSRRQDPPEKISFVDQHWLLVNGGEGLIDISGDVIYLAMALRNVGRGMAVLHGWVVRSGTTSRTDPDHAPMDDFRRLTRDLYVPPGDLGFWQGALREPGEQVFGEIRGTVARRESITVELLYGDHEGGQRTITRFGLLPHEPPDGPCRWLCVAARHWNLDRGDPR